MNLLDSFQFDTYCTKPDPRRTFIQSLGLPVSPQKLKYIPSIKTTSSGIESVGIGSNDQPSAFGKGSQETAWKPALRRATSKCLLYITTPRTCASGTHCRPFGGGTTHPFLVITHPFHSYHPGRAEHRHYRSRGQADHCPAAPRHRNLRSLRPRDPSREDTHW